MLTSFICINCGEPSIIRLLAVTPEFETLGVELCKCKGDVTKQVKKETNITSLVLYREKLLEKGIKK